MHLKRPPAMWLPLVLLFSIWCSHAKADGGPRIISKKFDTIPTLLQYFEDSDIVLVQERERGLIWRSEDAGANWKQLDVIGASINEVVMHPFDKNMAYALSRKNKHWVTKDRGDTWSSFEITDVSPSDSRPPLSFHAGDSKKVIFNGQNCKGRFSCDELALYTTDGFVSMHTLREDTRGCYWAHSTELFKTGMDDEDNLRALCVVKGRFSPWPKDHRLLVSDNFFETELEPRLEENRPVQGIIKMAMVKKYLVVAARAEGTSELALYVTDDAEIWHRAKFPHNHKLEEDAYTILESTNYSLQVDVMTTKPTNAMGVLFSSNSNGTYFTENIKHTNRNFFGIVDFEKVQDIQGIVTVNVVDNWEDIERMPVGSKNIMSRISFDDGRTFQSLKSDKDDLHLHSVTAMENVGRVFSSAAPGIVMGVGNTGKYLSPYDEGDLYVSKDAGLTWRFALSEAHKYEFGDQGSVLLAVYDEAPTDKISFSTDHGDNWEEAKLDDKIRARVLTTTPDSTSLKFLLVGTVGGGSNMEYYIYSIDFEALEKRKCKEDDFEKWYARLDEDGKPDCLMGHKQYYMRRKADADCFVESNFDDPEKKFDVCKCSKEDFECDYNFVKDEDGKCMPAITLEIPKSKCKSPEDNYKGSSGYRLIPGNACEGGEELANEIERPCKEGFSIPSNGVILNTQTSFKAQAFRSYLYLERAETTSGDDETIVVSTNENEIWISKDHGKNWAQLLEEEEIIAIVPNQYDQDVIYFLTATDKVFYSYNRGATIDSFTAPHPPNQEGLAPLAFHPDHNDWLIWTGAVDCKNGVGGQCHSVASVTKRRGENWDTLVRYVKKCEFIKREGRGNYKKLIYCEQHQGETPNGKIQLLASDNFFEDHDFFAENGADPNPFPNILAFATMAEFIIVAARDEATNLKVDASIDGKTFAPAKFPPDFDVPIQNAYTVLDSSTHAVFLHVTVSQLDGFEYGRLMKSNSNGTSYVLSCPDVNRNKDGYVDFEKMQGLEGVAIANVVTNIEDESSGKAKQLKTLITHNDGAEWAFLEPPQVDSNGEKYECDLNSRQQCSLHLHGYTERKDPRDTFSSASAIGLMMGIGNVGESLGKKPDASLFLTSDGGISWKCVMKGNYMWEYGDQGSIIIIVEENVATNILYYTINEGKDWVEHKFADQDMMVSDLTTLPSDNSKNFLIWGKKAKSDKDISVINVDFSGLKDRKCVLNDENPRDEDSDYYLWEPEHPLQKDTKCLFGHVAQYHRKKPEADCWNGYMIHRLHDVAKNCACVRQDFECDYNYALSKDGSCVLVPGLKPIDHSLECKANPEQVSYWDPTGYRRIPLTTCSQGRELEYTSEEKPCPGHEKEYEEAHPGMNGFVLFLLAFVLPVATASAIGYWVWTNYGAQFGRIRLGETGGAFDADQPWIQYPVLAVSAIVAVLAAIPLLVASVWRSASGMFGGGRRYTTRESFARGRGDYAVVDPDEDELLGDDDDEEV